MGIQRSRERERDDIIAWRCDQLARSGFPPSLASRLAREPRLDLHAVIELAERGCPPELAVRILLPVDEEVSAA